MRAHARTRLAAAALAGLALAGCGGGGSEPAAITTAPPARTSAPPPERTISLRAYFLRDGRIAAAGRQVPETRAVAAAALRALFAGPSEARLTSAIPGGATWIGLGIEDGMASLSLPGEYSHAALAQVVYTLTQFPTVRAVELGGARLTRADFEDVTPPILVESPTPGERVASPLRVTGTANTFEATLQLKLVDPGGRVLAEQAVTATSGSGTRGTFEAIVPFSGASEGQGTLVAFESSAEDGSPIHVVEIPVTMSP